MKFKLFLVSLFVLHIGLSMLHINHTTMWDDEASVVWFAKNYNQQGQIIGYDGTHLFSYRNGQLINNELAYNNPPLDIYYAAFVMRHFGDTDFILRFAFLLAGLVALIVFVACFWLITRKDKVWFLFASSFLILSVNYLLIEANTRYYSLNFLFAATSLWATLLLLHAPAIKSKIGFLLVQLLSLYFLFLSHYLAAVCWWVMLTFLLWHQGAINFDFRKKINWIFLGCSSVLFGFIVRYMIVERVLDRPDLETTDTVWIKYRKLVEWLFVDLHSINLIPLWVVLVFGFLWFARKHLLSSAFRNLWYYTLVFIGLILLLNPQSTSESRSFDIRYLYVVMPLLYLLIAYLFKLLYEASQKMKVLSVVLAGLFINTTLLSALPSDNGPQWLLPNFVKEAVNPYPTAYSEVLKYIDQHFDGRKKVLTLPGYHNTVFFRYIPQKIDVTNTLWPNTQLKPAVIDSLGMSCLFVGHCKPDYIFQFGSSETLAKYPFKASDYKFIDTIAIYAYGVDVTRPELYWHSFGPKKIRDIKTEALYIYHN